MQVRGAMLLAFPRMNSHWKVRAVLPQPFCLLCNANPLSSEKGNPYTSCHSSSWKHLFAFALGSQLRSPTQCHSAPNGARAEEFLLSILQCRCMWCFIIPIRAVCNVLALIYPAPDLQRSCASRCLSPVYIYSCESTPWAQLWQLCMQAA